MLMLLSIFTVLQFFFLSFYLYLAHIKWASLKVYELAYFNAEVLKNICAYGQLQEKKCDNITWFEFFFFFIIVLF